MFRVQAIVSSFFHFSSSGGIQLLLHTSADKENSEFFQAIDIPYFKITIFFQNASPKQSFRQSIDAKLKQLLPRTVCGNICVSHHLAVINLM